MISKRQKKQAALSDLNDGQYTDEIEDGFKIQAKILKVEKCKGWLFEHVLQLLNFLKCESK